MLKDVLEEEGKKVFLLGNEAIARGALEAGIDVFAAYPGTPSSEIADTLSEACKVLKGFMYMEYSTNEKVAFEVALGASLAGKRGMCAMKHVGVNVASDALFSFAYIGARGGFVLVSADDPFMHSSQNEQDNRWFGISAKVPVVEASSVQEVKDITKEAFEISEKFGLPMILRSYTRLSHARGVVELGKIPDKKLEKVEWVKKPETDVVLPSHARRLKKELWKKLERLEKFFCDWDRNWVNEGDDKRLGIIACGLSYAYAKEAVRRLNLEIPILKLSSMHPLPMKLIENFVSEVDRVMVVEEVDPFVELQVRTIAKDVYGKLTGHMPMDYEFNVAIVERGIAKLLGMATSRDYEAIERRADELAKLAPPRPPVLCPGCPHSATFYVIRKVVNELGKACLPSDIGCYTLGINKPFEAVDICICMGASVGVSNGLFRVIKDPIIATIGDSTFLHAGIPALINAVYNKAKFVLVVLDNLTTGMTGHQPHPGVGVTGCGESGGTVKIEDVARGVGVDFVEVVNPYNIKKLEEVLKKALEHDGVAVIVARQKCAILRVREMRKKGVKPKPFEVTEKCNACMKCVTEFICPAIFIEDGKPKIDPALCTSCGVCAKICPEKAIRVRS
jgi:indolepyruvate ferredoxin oxidoreductase alpha subunit